ncbi:MAG: stage III sporulation protein AG [Lachnospiraceae bacterium]|nr:stage III sporulation protein AG [Lachnospiraceae bacterium]
MRQWRDKWKSIKKDQIVILLLFGLLLVVIAWPSGDGADEASSVSEQEASAQTPSANLSSEEDAENLTTELETRLSGILSQVQGIGETRVMITLKSDGRKIVEKDTEQSEEKEESTDEGSSSSSWQSSAGESTIYEKASDGSETPFVTEELAPEILGVLVIAQGADDSLVVTEITEAVMALFGVEAHKIKVMKME